MPCPHTDVSQPNSSVPSGTPPALLLVGIALGRGGRKQRNCSFSEEAVSFLRGPAQLEEKTGVSGISEVTGIPRQRGMLILPECCRWVSNRKVWRAHHQHAGTYPHQQYFKEKGWVVQTSHLQVQCCHWGLEKEAFHCTRSPVLTMCWGEPSWQLNTVCLGSNSL